jgi:hypothetical protein
MKAAFIEQFGGREVLRYGNLPDPVAAPGEVVTTWSPVNVPTGRCASVSTSNRSFHSSSVAIFPA